MTTQEREILIGDIKISPDSDCFLIAEIGHNHQGCIIKCKELFNAAKEAGATAVKLQKRDNKNLFTKEFYNQPYLSRDAYGSTYGQHREALEFYIAELILLHEYAQKIGILFFATPFDITSVNVLATLNVPCFKIASCDIKNYPLLDYIAALYKPIILSTGGATIDEIKDAASVISRHHSQFILLQCTAAYPTKDDEVNLTVITTFLKEFPDKIIGYSGHDLGTTMSLAAFVLGARVIEKHFTLDKSLPGNDHRLSLSFEEFSFLSKELARLKVAMGNGNKCIFESEKNALKKMGKKIVAAKSLPIGHTIDFQDLSVKSPGDGLAPSLLKYLIGKKLKYCLAEEENFSLEHVE